MTVRYTGAATFPAQGTPAQTGHLRGEAGFVNAHQTLRIKVRLEIKPVLSSLQDVFTLLLQCMSGLFLNVHPCCRSQRLSMLRPIPTARSLFRRAIIS